MTCRHVDAQSLIPCLSSRCCSSLFSFHIDAPAGQWGIISPHLSWQSFTTCRRTPGVAMSYRFMPDLHKATSSRQSPSLFCELAARIPGNLSSIWRAFLWTPFPTVDHILEPQVVKSSSHHANQKLGILFTDRPVSHRIPYFPSAYHDHPDVPEDPIVYAAGPYYRNRSRTVTTASSGSAETASKTPTSHSVCWGASSESAC